MWLIDEECEIMEKLEADEKSWRNPTDIAQQIEDMSQFKLVQPDFSRGSPNTFSNARSNDFKDNVENHILLC